MKKIFTLFTMFLTATFASAQCHYVVDMQDSYGDGWNGASIDVSVNGSTVANMTCSGPGSIDSIATLNGDAVEFYFNSGSWDTEITFQITAPDGSSVGSYGPYPTNSGNSYSVWTGVSNATCVPNYTIDMQDSWGDGWNGASVMLQLTATVANWAIWFSGSDSIATINGDVVDLPLMLEL